MIIRIPSSPSFGALLSLFICAPLSSSFASAADSLQDIERVSNQSLLWGPYRPNLYFGVRPRIPESLMVGLLWSKVEDYQSVQENLRYTCEQHAGMAGYGWEKYDPRHGGIQTIHDAGNEIDITTSFYKDTSAKAGTKGGNWGVRIKGVPREGASENLKTTMIFNAYFEGEPNVYNNLVVVGSEEEAEGGFEGDVVLTGETPALGPFKITVKGDEGTSNQHPTHGHPSGAHKALDRTFVQSSTFPKESVWQAKPIFFAMLKQQIDEYISSYTKEDPPPPAQLYTIKPKAGSGNTHFVQKVFEGAFEFDILFSSGSANEEITSSELTTGIGKILSSFDERFLSFFRPETPFTASKFVEFSQSLFSNLLGGIGYFYGDWKVDRTYAPEYEEENEGFWEEAAEARSRAGFSLEGPNELFTSIPSRPFFPRGFWWDEGFHLLPVIDWDVDLSLQIIKSWFSLIDDDGWVGREQILGAEARSKVPDEFQVQYPHYANPPTLFLTVQKFIRKLARSSDNDVDLEYAPQVANKAAAQAYLKELYPLLQRHYEWFRRTQQGDIAGYDREATSPKEGYRWRGRTERHCLTSGMDDFPRAQPPHPGELHVDALAWVGLMSDSLVEIAEFLEEDDDATTYKKQLDNIKANIIDLHWSEGQGIFCDATIDDFEEHKHVCHRGYVTILPFALGLLDSTKHASHISAILKSIEDPNDLWSPHGIRSLSKQSELYGTDENYWRSPIWVNINYLILNQLYQEGQLRTANGGKARHLYNALRKNLVNTVYDSWKETGFAWEQYNPETGKGQRTQHFTGWTSLVVNILAMPELKDSAAKGRDEL